MYGGQNDNKNKIKQALSGGSASLVARVLAQPFDVLKIRFQLQVEPINQKYKNISKYMSMRQAIKSIYREEGITAFWKGNVPAITLSFLIGFIQFSTYEQFVLLSKGFYIHEKHPNINNFLCGSAGGILAVCIVQPIELAKTRFISQDSKKAYRNFRHACAVIYRNEGIRGLYRGLTPAIIEISPYNGMNFMFYRYLTETAMSISNVKKRQQLPVFWLMSFGAISACFSKLLIHPLDMMKKRLHIQGFEEHRKTFGEHAVCRNIYNCIVNIVKEEGFLSLYKGLTPSLMKNAVTIAVQFSLYDTINNFLKIQAS